MRSRSGTRSPSSPAAVLRQFYRGDADVAADGELQAWVRELANSEIGNFRGLADVGGGLASLDRLVQVATTIVFVATAEHSSTNNGQYDMYGYIPNVPGALFAPPPRSKAPLSEQSLVEALPSPATAAEQIGMVHLLSEPTEQPLGRYAPEFFAGNPEIAPIVERFDAALHAIARQIDARTRSSPFPTPTCIPRSFIPASRFDDPPGRDMIDLPGYRIDETLHGGLHFTHLSRVRLDHDASVIVKVNDAPEQADPRASARLEREYALTRALDDPGIVIAHSVQRVGRHCALVFPDSGRISSAHYLEGRTLPLPLFFLIARQVAETLGRIHAREGVHKDVRPTNILVDPQTLSTQLTDFGIAVARARATPPSIRAPEELEVRCLHRRPSRPAA